MRALRGSSLRGWCGPPPISGGPQLALWSFIPTFVAEGEECGNCACSDAEQEAEDYAVEPTQARHVAPMQRLMREQRSAACVVLRRGKGMVPGFREPFREQFASWCRESQVICSKRSLRLFRGAFTARLTR